MLEVLGVLVLTYLSVYVRKIDGASTCLGRGSECLSGLVSKWNAKSKHCLNISKHFPAFSGEYKN